MKNFANFKGKHVQGSPILRKAADMGLQLYKNRTSLQLISYEFYEKLFFIEPPG